ncbi:ATP-binding protein [Pandoraea pnomenusa]|uniref:AlbA family DNA-binding domain-containing protein n=1 Tax=Pandoraea pnomenusa TaxID=93220 RepID=UPI00333EBBC1
MNVQSNNVPLFELLLENADTTYFEQIKASEEGWFVEFKAACPDSQKLAKSVSSFANAYGGVLLIGVQEDAKTRRFERFSPVTRDDADSTITRLRQAIEAHLQPCPYFETRALEIPEVHTDIAERWIVAIRVPKGKHPPYLHSSGVVYTRKGDSASPTSLNDLGLLDRLWGESKEKRQAVGKRLEFLSDQSRSAFPRLEIAFHATRDGVAPAREISFEEFQKVAAAPVASNGVALLANCYTIGGGYVARHAGDDVVPIAPLWEYDVRTGLHYICLPLASRMWRGDASEVAANGHWPQQALVDHLVSVYPHSKQELLVLDLGPTLYFLSAILFMVAKLYEGTSDKLNLRTNLKAASVRHSVPYLELPRFARRLATGKLPYLHRDVDFLYPLDVPENWLPVEFEGNVTPINGLNLEIPNSIGLFVRITRALGIPSEVTVGGSEDIDEGAMTDISALFGRLAGSSFSFTLVENPKSR